MKTLNKKTFPNWRRNPCLEDVQQRKYYTHITRKRSVLLLNPLFMSRKMVWRFVLCWRNLNLMPIPFPSKKITKYYNKFLNLDPNFTKLPRISQGKVSVWSRIVTTSIWDSDGIRLWEGKPFLYSFSQYAHMNVLFSEDSNKD